MYLCDELLMINEDELDLRVVGGNEDIPSTLKIDLFLKIVDVKEKFIFWVGGGGMSFHLHMVSPK